MATERPSEFCYCGGSLKEATLRRSISAANLKTATSSWKIILSEKNNNFVKIDISLQLYQKTSWLSCVKQRWHWLIIQISSFDFILYLFVGLHMWKKCISAIFKSSPNASQTFEPKSFTDLDAKKVKGRCNKKGSYGSPLLLLKVYKYITGNGSKLLTTLCHTVFEKQWS